MKHILKLMVLAVMLLTFRAEGYSAEPIRLRVLSYNIHHGAGVDSKLDLQRIADVILSVKPDVVALQEVDKNVKRSGDVDQPAELARLTKMNVVFGANIDLQGGHYGNAILSRFPIIRHENHRLPNIDDGEQRGMIEAEIALPKSNQPLRLLATHLDHRPDQRERLASATFINERLDGHPQLPALLAGDMNARPDSETLRRLQAKWTSANQTPMATYPVTQPTIQIDYILHSPAIRWKIIEFKVLDEAVASDHRAIFAVLELQTGDE
ncbi:Endonuclease/Exonuclease/phosphatase family protein [Rosistilla carotiformis]|uniref:Endonuclease/Exonuclease/phosphatase family protein n=1 Tax=Rosistilla carotiformis TaxID=2528017 RepID=A0A518JUD1_9BACT|nr:endonuclease/exonuclease/phosphatase family protein [Rosistilla carotiformis]QDV69096.1 Endonuclease/Exonuclease/phosphatase family protein [Rosistilla carotiformis]